MAPENKSADGEELVKQELISREDLDLAKERERLSGTPWYRQLLQMNKINLGVLDDYLKREFHPKSVRDQNVALGDTLLSMGAVTQKQLDEALKEQKRNGRLLGAILLHRGYVDKPTISRGLARQAGMEFAQLDKTPSEQYALDSVAESVARKHGMIPIKLDGDKLTVLTASPMRPDQLQDASVLLGMRISPMLTAVDDIKEEISARYKGKNVVSSKANAESAVTKDSVKIAEKTPKPPKQSTPEEDKKPEKETEMADEKATVEVDEAVEEEERGRFDEIAREASGVPVIKLVQTILEGAINSGATDIHLDPQEPEMRVRYRIDGVLHDVMSIPEEIQHAVVSRVKILTDMDITETRHPQDGHMSIEAGHREFDVRVATLPTFLGERVVLRLLDQASVLAGIKDLGLEEGDEKKLAEIIDEPYGMVLVTGPTGSGKTTTLYACLNQKNVMTESIVTLEDPVEYQLSGINQVQIEQDIDLTFASTLRAALRQDIDVLLVGEIRDADTAHIAIRAAMTGHLVFSTLHTNDAPEAISTLRNMGIPSYLIASALTAVVAQRLVRKICENCKTSFTPNKTLLKSLGLPESTRKLYRGKGCEACYGTGHRGRTGVFEILTITEAVRKLIVQEAPVSKIANAAKLKTMAERSRQKVKRGDIDPNEFLRVIRT